MRIIGGTKRGAKLETLPGEATRPTLDRIKEAVFSMIAFDIPGAHVLDLFAGSGAIGLECISRGASSADLVDVSKEANAVMRRNCEKLGMLDSVCLYRSDWRAFLMNPAKRRRYDLVYLDPPYGEGLIRDALILLESEDLLADEALIVAESSAPSDFDFDLSATKIQRRKSKKYGKITVNVYRRGEV